MILTRYYSQRSMSIQRIARAGKCTEEKARYFLLLCGNESKAIAYARSK